MSGACPALGTEGRDLGPQHASLRWPAARSIPAPFLGLLLPAECLPWAHRRGKLGVFGLGRGRGPGDGRGPSRAPPRRFRATRLGGAARALRAKSRGAPETPLSRALSPLRAAGAVSVHCCADHVQHCQFSGPSACARGNVIRLYRYRDA